MARLGHILEQMRNNPKGVRFSDLCKVCDKWFGKARNTGSSHRVYKMPWQGGPRVNIQDSNGMAKAYQVRQVLRAIEEMEKQHGKDIG